MIPSFWHAGLVAGVEPRYIFLSVPPTWSEAPIRFQIDVCDGLPIGQVPRSTTEEALRRVHPCGAFA